MNISTSVTNRALIPPPPSSLTGTPRPDAPGSGPASLTELAAQTMAGQPKPGIVKPASLTDLAMKMKQAIAPTNFVDAARTAGQVTGGPLLFEPGSPSLTGSLKRATDLAPGRADQVTTVTDAAKAEQLSETKIAEIAQNLSLDGLAKDLEPFFKDIADKAIARVIKTRDRDSDGVLTPRELKISTDRFREIDRDGDGKVTVDELTTSLKNALGKAARIDPTLDPDGFAAQWFKSLDIDRNASLTQFEAPLPVSLFEQADADANGELSLSEVKNAIDDRSPAIDRRQRLEDIAMSITQQLDKAGFTDRPPTNIRSLVDGLNLDQFSSQFLLQALSTRYPHGLGISLFG